jgi:hypothetical protein
VDVASAAVDFDERKEPKQQGGSNPQKSHSR